MSNTINLADEDIGLLADRVTEVEKSSFKGISKQQMCLTNKLTNHVNKLTEAINEVKITIEAEAYGVDPNSTLEELLLFSPLKIGFNVQALETCQQAFGDVTHDFKTLIIDFSKLTLVEVYVVHHGATTRIRIQENDLAYQAKNQTIKEKRRKDLLQKNEKEIEA